MTARRTALLLSFGLAEASVLMPLILLLPTPLRLFDSGAALAAAWLAICAVAATRRALALRDVSWNTQRLVMGGWLVGLLAAFVAGLALSGQLTASIDAVLVVELVCVLLLWWRGASLGASDLQPDAARLRLQIGLVMFVLFGTATMFDRNTNLFGFIVPFLAGAVFAMPLSHLERVERSRIGRRFKMDRRWWLSVAAGAGIPLALSLLATLLLAGDTLGQGLQLLIAILLLPLLLVAFIIGALLAELLQALFQRKLTMPDLQALSGLFGQFAEEAEKTEQSAGLVIPEGVRIALVFVAVALFIAFVVYYTERARRQAAGDQDETETLQNVSEEGGPPALASRLADVFNLRRWLAALSVRRIYARMMHESGKRGHPRLPAQTPYDCLPALRLAFPGADAEVEIITRAYVAAHYGEVPDTPEELDAIRAAWERARASRPIAQPA